jgi:hypothetical protein
MMHTKPVNIANHMQLIEEAKMQLYCNGVIRYRDIFGQLRHTTFCLVYRPERETLGPCADGNEAD